MSILHVFAGSLWRPEESVWLPGTELRAGCEPRNACWNQTQVLCRSSQCSLSPSHLSKNPLIGFYRVSRNTLFTEEPSKLKFSEDTIRDGASPTESDPGPASLDYATCWPCADTAQMTVSVSAMYGKYSVALQQEKESKHISSEITCDCFVRQIKKIKGISLFSRNYTSLSMPLCVSLSLFLCLSLSLSPYLIFMFSLSKKIKTSIVLDRAL